MGIFEWTATTVYIPEKVRCRTYVWRDGRLACSIFEKDGKRTEFKDKNGEVRWLFAFEFISSYFQVIFDFAWAIDAMRSPQDTLKDELQQLSVLQAFFEERADGTEFPLLCVMYDFEASAEGGIEMAGVRRGARRAAG